MNMKKRIAKVTYIIVKGTITGFPITYVLYKSCRHCLSLQSSTNCLEDSLKYGTDLVPLVAPGAAVGYIMSVFCGTKSIVTIIVTIYRVIRIFNYILSQPIMPSTRVLDYMLAPLEMAMFGETVPLTTDD